MPNTDYLAFDAFTIKELMNQRLSEGNVFTDQLFEGSNISVLVDAFAYLYDILTFMVNQGASESVFIDASLYENVNRMVKMLGYNPKGWIPATLDIRFETGSDINSISVPRYVSFGTGLTDSFGNSVYYSTVDDNLNISFSSEGLSDSIKLYNGLWKKYPSNTISDVTSDGASFDVEGIPFERFVLDELDQTDPDDPEYVGHPFVHLYVERDGEIETDHFKPVSQGTLFGSSGSFYGPEDRVYELRLNENKQYEIRFGDGVHGRRLKNGDKLHVYYLKTSSEGTVGSEFFDGTEDTKNEVKSMERLTTGWYKMFLDINDPSDSIDKLKSGGNVYFRNTSSSSTPVEPESSEQIKRNAPDWFRSGGTLVTKDDFRNYVITVLRNNIQDVKVMDNWEYLSEFMQWVYRINSDYLTKQRFSSEFYKFADSCDFNNIYLWVKYINQPLSAETVEGMIEAKKTQTIEPIVLQALSKYFVPCHSNKDDKTVNQNPNGSSYSGYETDNWDPYNENYIEIIYNNASDVSISKLKDNVVNTITEWFMTQHNELGMNMNMVQLYNRILSMSGVKDIYTVYVPYDETNDTYNYNEADYFSGLSFFTWTPDIVDGEDLQRVDGDIKLRDFHFPVLYSASDLSERVKVVFESYNISNVEY